MSSARDTARTPFSLEAPVSERNIHSLTMRQITKRYGPTVALQDVDFDLHVGEIHALLGENGAGKTTLMHILSGFTQPDTGEILLNGSPVSIRSPRDARNLGIAMVHQHFTLVPALTVEENLALDAPPTSHPRFYYRPQEAARKAIDQAAKLGWQLNPKARIADLPVGLQQRVEIAKVLATNAHWLIFDEPTAVLIGKEIDELFEVLRALRDSGKGIVFITHKLAEIMVLADRVTILRRGKKVATAPVSEVNPSTLAQWMVGEDVTTHTYLPTPAPYPRTSPAFRAENLTIYGDRGETVLQDISFEVYQGEIFGVGGVDGNGQTELAETIVGLRSSYTGQMLWYESEFCPGKRPRTGYIPQDRRRAGLALSMSVEENLLFDAIKDPRFRWGPFLRRSALRKLAQTLIQEFDIRTASLTTPASALSGGNQQKIVVARALQNNAEWLVAVNPVRGLDIQATRFVHEQILNAKTRGAAIVLISTDIDELAALCDRTVILSNRKMHPIQLSKQNATQLGLLLGGVALSESSHQ